MDTGVADAAAREAVSALPCRAGALAVVLVCQLAASGCFLERVEETRGSTANRAATQPDADLAKSLKAHVEKLAVEIGPRSFMTPDNLDAAANYIDAELRSVGRGDVRRVPYRIDPRWER